MPSLVPAVLGRLLAALGDDATAAILEVDGPRPILPMALATEPAGAAVRRLVGAGERRLGALLDDLDVRVVPQADGASTIPTAGPCATSTRRPTSSPSAGRSARRRVSARTDSRRPPNGGRRGP